MKKAAALLAVMILASFGLVACGGGDDSDTTGGTTAETTTEGGDNGGGSDSGTLAIAAADSGLAYASDTASSSPGKVTVEFDNPQPIAHDVAFEDESGETIGQTEIITDASDSTVVDFKPGSYQFYCTVPGHREAGMEGELTVE
ncbi:MAG TPA: plastocyanin/azurin family copper-binding protein [Solirubrobacterales bacterium]|nr:plastocyanin/azurin family copper-binding protein [Solirubrobacterales bacterium]